MPVEFVWQVNDCEEDGKPEWCPLKNCNIQEYDDALRLMVYQYCIAQKQFLKGKDCDWPNQEVFFNSYMSAGENAFKMLGIENFQKVPKDWVRG